jgi:hypothetical protein
MATSPGRGPRLLLWLLAALGAVVGATLLTLGLVAQAGRPDPDMVGFTAGQQVQVGEGGLSVWSRSPGTFRDTVCTADGTTLLRPVSGYAVDVAGSRFHEVARSPEGMASGPVQLSCSTTEPLYAGPRADSTAVTGLAGGTGVFLGALLLAVAVVLAVLAVLEGRRRMPEGHGSIPLSRLMPETARAGTAYPGLGGTADRTVAGPRGPRYDLPPPD